MIKIYNDKSQCCGCTACMVMCPKKAISMITDEKGFMYPVIDTKKCIDCGLCKKSCAFQSDEKGNSDPRCFVGTHKNEDIYRNSQSGGAFTAISDIILENNGIVYAARLDEDFVTRHTRIETKSQRDSCRKSKYVQSSMINRNNEYVFTNVSDDLEANRTVLFCGTGCQCDALKHYLLLRNADITKLYTIDIICNGVGTPLAVKKYLKWVEDRHRDTVTGFEFRDTDKFPYGTCVEKIKLNSGKLLYQDYYANLYYHHIIRENCYNCKYTSFNRNTDFTIGDAWGIERTHPEMKGKYGCSVILFHTKKALSFLDSLKDSMNLLEVEQQEIMQPRLSEPGKKPEDYDIFWNDFVSLSFETLMKKWGLNQYSASRRIFFKCKRIIKFPIRTAQRILKKNNGK